jgi:hypothetical protein
MLGIIDSDSENEENSDTEFDNLYEVKNEVNLPEVDSPKFPTPYLRICLESKKILTLIVLIFASVARNRWIKIWL